MRLGELDDVALILLGVNAIMWGINIGLLSLWIVK
ncbi:Uncharacterised protein [Yersinia enterocolitica]|uniref:Uncharacterized protein n=3 Tax=Yersinia TaxID=629 RepID=A0A0T9UQG6_YERAE|nr:hypothetical protein PB70LOC_01378 [Pectobacterium versatile]UXD28232.1 hypothetical protein FORC066_1017 [Yersinia enterocolitica]CFQ30662.1 Uncharacterised protein [Yersinia bercovieri]CFR09981.1 Uncharacterised protein [Yersinia frederiksenii]CNF21051.1 Uncharacterised protein [Yersinia mollaretii]CNF99448.1 Uncharacterised protein [Yersinia pseudotuberculosis]CNL61395.1 Uncharacterised protein [Yersinia aleksiciae]CQI91519.1 Uncharacterised protein [Yersinia rohdei]STH94187.1 Unchara